MGYPRPTCTRTCQTPTPRLAGRGFAVWVRGFTHTACLPIKSCGLARTSTIKHWWLLHQQKTFLLFTSFSYIYLLLSNSHYLFYFVATCNDFELFFLNNDFDLKISNCEVKAASYCYDFGGVMLNPLQSLRLFVRCC